MRHIRTPAMLAAVAAVLAPIAAEAARPAPAEPTAAQVAAARTAADAMIAASGAPDLFRNVTVDDAPRIVHLPSRLLCYFDADAGDDRLETGSGDQRDDVVSCVTGDGEVTRRLSASRAGGTGAAEQRAQAAIATLRAARPGAGPATKPARPLAWKLGVPLAGYTFETPGEGRTTAVNVSAIDVREWAVTHETTSAEKSAKISAMVAQTLSEIYLTLTLYEMAGVTVNGEPAPS